MERPDMYRRIGADPDRLDLSHSVMEDWRRAADGLTAAYLQGDYSEVGASARDLTRRAKALLKGLQRRVPEAAIGGPDGAIARTADAAYDAYAYGRALSNAIDAVAAQPHYHDDILPDGGATYLVTRLTEALRTVVRYAPTIPGYNYYY